MGCSASVGGREVFGDVGMAVAVGRELSCSRLLAVVGVEVAVEADAISRRVT